MKAAGISARLADRIENLAEHLLGKPTPFHDKKALRFRGKGSLRVFVNGAERGRFYDHESNDRGDALDLVCRVNKCSLKEAMTWSCGWLGIDTDYDPDPPRPAPATVKPPKPPANNDDADRRTEMARQIWINSVPPIGTLVEKYLASRGLLLPRSDALRFHGQCPCGKDRFPAMLALMTDPVTGDPTGVHRTFLAADGSGKAPIGKERQKLMLGPAGVIRLSADEDVCRGLGLAEGIETALSVLQIAHWAPIWAAGSSGAIAKFPTLPGVEALTVFADADDKGAGMVAARDCAERWRSAGREMTIEQPPSGADWNDMLGKGGR